MYFCVEWNVKPTSVTHCHRIVLSVAALNDVTVDVIDDAELVVSLVIGADVVVMMRLWWTLDCRCLLSDQRPFTLPVNSESDWSWLVSLAADGQRRADDHFLLDVVDADVMSLTRLSLVLLLMMEVTCSLMCVHGDHLQ